MAIKHKGRESERVQGGVDGKGRQRKGNGEWEEEREGVMCKGKEKGKLLNYVLIQKYKIYFKNKQMCMFGHIFQTLVTLFKF